MLLFILIFTLKTDYTRILNCYKSYLLTGSHLGPRLIYVKKEVFI